MKRSLLTAALSALLLSLFALPLAADTVVSPEGEATPVPAEGEIVPPATPATAYEACLAEVLDPSMCGGVPVTPPLEGCPPGESCEISGTVPVEPQVNQAALMAAEEAAAEAVADAVAEEGPGAVDSAAAYLAALGAAREAAREVGADEGTAEAAAETAAIGAIAREAASEAAGDEGSGAVDGAAAYLAALGAAREADASEESAPTTVGRAVVTSSDEIPESEEAGSSKSETGASEDKAAKDDETSSGAGNATSSAEDEASSISATPTEGEASSSGEEEVPFEAVATALPAAEDGASRLVLGAGVLLLVAGIVGLLVRRGLAMQGSRELDQQAEEEEATEEEAARVRRLPQRSLR